jgi:lipid-A-disaccharide synthase
MPLEPDRAAARAQLGLDAGAPVLALLPGSRLGEISRLGAPFLDAAAKVAGEIPGLQVVIPAANASCRRALEALLSGFPALDPRPLLLDGQARTAMVAADVVLLASGTATLEAMLAKRPMVVGYRIAPLTHAIVKGMGMLKVDRYALPNVLAGADLAPELMQHDCTPGKLAEAVLGWFHNPGSVMSLQARYREIHEELRQDASSRAADAVAQLVGGVPGR